MCTSSIVCPLILGCFDDRDSLRNLAALTACVPNPPGEF